MKVFKRSLLAAFLAAGALGGVAATPGSASASEAAAPLPAGTYSVYDSSGKLVGYMFVSANGTTTFAAIRDVRQV
jgi:hypothetical protein